MTDVEKYPMSHFWAIFSTQSISLLGSQIVQFSLIWWLTKSSGSASVLATASIMAFLPQVFVSPIAGAYVDRWNRRLIMIVTDALTASMVLVLAVLFALNLVQVWHVYILILLRAVGGAFQFPTMQASTTLMVEKESLSRIAGLNQALSGLVNILAPAIGALLYDIWALQNILLLDIATAVLAVAILFMVVIPQPKAKTGKTSLTSDLRDGFRYLVNWRGGVYLTLGALLINLFFVPAISLTAILVQTIFGGEAIQFATLESTLGIGMVLGGLTLGVWGGFHSKVKTAMVALTVAGAGAILIGVLPPTAFNLLVACFFLIGAMLPLINGSLFALMQALVPPELQGRVMTILISLSAAMAPVGLAFAGPLSDAWGVQIWFIIGGMVMAGFGVASFFVPTMAAMDEHSSHS